MKRITTDRACEGATLAVLPADVSTPITCLAGVVAVHFEDLFPEHLCFIPDELQEMCRTPASDNSQNLGLLSSFYTHLHCRDIQFFDGDCITVAVDYALAEAVVSVSDEPSLSPAQLDKVSFCGASACSLKASFDMSIPSFDVPQLLAVEELIVRCDRRIVGSSVDADYLLDLPESRCFDVGHYVEEDLLSFDSDSCGSRFSEVILAEVVGNLDVVDSAAEECADADRLGFGEELECVVVEPNRACLFLDRSLLELEPFEHVAGLVAHRRDQGAVERRISCSDCFVGEVVEAGLVVDLFFDADVDDVLASSVREDDCLLESFVSVDSCGDCDLHNYPLNHNIYKYVSISCVYEHPKNQTCDLQHQLPPRVVPEIPKASSCRPRSEAHRGQHNQRGVCSTWVGTVQLGCAGGPSSCVPLGSTYLFSDVHREGSQGCYGSSCCEGSSFCETVLESELLCRDCGDSHRSEHQEVYPRTRTTEVKVAIPHRIIECGVPSRH